MGKEDTSLQFWPTLAGNCQRNSRGDLFIYVFKFVFNLSSLLISKGDVLPESFAWGLSL